MKIQRNIWVGFLGALLVFLRLLVWAAHANSQQVNQNIPIQNPSFDQGAVGWNFGPNSGIEAGSAYAGYGGSFSQNLGISPKTIQQPSVGWQYVTEGVYVLKFSVVNYFRTYPGYYAAKLTFGTQELCETSGWGKMHLSQITLTCPSPGYLILDKLLPGGGVTQGTNDLVLTFSANDESPNGGWPVLFDDVSLTFTPQ